MTKTFTRDGVEYTVTPCTAVSLFDIHEDGTYDPINRQDALQVVSHINGEEFEYIVFGYDMPETEQDFDDMAENTSAWECDHAVLNTAWTDPTTNRQIVQKGLNARAEARAEATQEAQDDLFLDELNKLTAEASRNMTAALEAAQRRVREQKREQRREQRQATRRDTFMQRIFTAVAIIAVVIWLHIIEAVVFWLALTIGIIGLLYIIVTIWCYYGIGRKRKKDESHA